MPAGKERDLQLGADAVGRADQNGLAETREPIGRAKGSDVGQYARRKRLARELFDGRDGAVAFVDIDARIAVTNLFFGGQVSV